VAKRSKTKMKDIELVLPYPPSVNHYWGHKAIRSKHTRRWQVVKYLSTRAKAFRVEVQARVFEQCGIPPKLRGRLAVIVNQHYGPRDEAHEHDGPRQDIDNCLKSLFDALEHASVYNNDSQIDELLVVRKRRAAIGRVEVIIKTIGE
jgi:crossover junction endodeoxyribonuclease RusA